MAQNNTNALATHFRKLHNPGDPLILCNVWDAASAKAVANVPNIKAIATASYAVAATQAVDDNDLTFEQNISAIRPIALVASQASVPLTVDLQDGYEDIAGSVSAIIKLGAVGCNIEDFNNQSRSMRSKEEATQRIQIAVETAKAAGVPDFCVNARTDIIGHGGSIDDAIDRAKGYLNVGASTAFVWGGGARGLTTTEVEKLVHALDGRLSVMMSLAPGKLTVSELRRIGVARISIGPALLFKANAAIELAVSTMLQT
jgi:2-methylisocitrate lyase-like PEP mutase family enzyme